MISCFSITLPTITAYTLGICTMVWFTVHLPKSTASELLTDISPEHTFAAISSVALVLRIGFRYLT